MSQEPMGPLFPKDEHNQRLESNVHPPDWKNPVADGKYNLVVIGAGTAGLVAASGAAGLGAKVALIERSLLGGDCLNVGCVPSKAIIASAHAAAAVRDAGDFGVSVPRGVEVDFPAAMERMRRLRAGISPHDSAERFTELGVDVFLGGGKFSGRDSVEVDGQELRFSRAVIATGARASAPPIPGIDEIDYLTNETLFSLTELPQHIGIVGAGPIGCEMSQTLARLGSRVTLFETMSGVLSREDPDVGAVIQPQLEKDGVHVLCCGENLTLAKAGDGLVRCDVDARGKHYTVEVDRLLVAVGRAPNVEDLGLGKAGVEHNRFGVVVNDRLQTANKRIFAAGDICSPFKFTHAADFMARTVIRNALFGGRSKMSSLIIPWCTYTSPEVAHVGESWQTLEEQADQLDTYKVEMSGVDRAVLEGDTEGFVKIHTKKGSGKIAAATIVARNAGDMISQISQAMTAGTRLGKIGNTISPYPTQGEAIRKAGDLYTRTRLTPTVAGLMKKWLAWHRR